MVSTQTLALEQRRPATDARLESLDVTGMRARRDAVATQLQLAEQSRDVTLLADSKQLDQWQRLVALESTAAWKAPENAEARERQRFLKGFLLWNLDSDFKLRLWRAQRGLRQLDRALGELEGRVVQIRGARAREPERLAAMRARISALSPRISTMQTAVNGALQEQESGLVALAVAELQAQKQRLSSYRVQARFALANLYDRAASSPARRTEAAPAESSRP